MADGKRDKPGVVIDTHGIPCRSDHNRNRVRGEGGGMLVPPSPDSHKSLTVLAKERDDALADYAYEVWRSRRRENALNRDAIASVFITGLRLGQEAARVNPVVDRLAASITSAVLAALGGHDGRA